MSNEDLIKLIKNQISLKKKLETKLTELTNSTANFSQIERVIESINLIANTIKFHSVFFFSNFVVKFMMNSQNIPN